MFERILVATDGSALAEGAVAVAASLAASVGARTAAVYVVDAPAKAAPLARRHLEEIKAELRADGEQALDRAAAMLGPGMERLVRDGHPGGEIVAAAHEWSASLVVLATHGRTGLRRAILGSVADTVARHCGVPVLLVPAPAEPAAG